MIAPVGALGTGEVGTPAAATITLTTTAAIAAGNVAILTWTGNNASTADGDNNEHLSVTDSSGAVSWTKLAEYCNSGGGAANDGVTTSLWYRPIQASELASGSAILCTRTDARQDQVVGASIFSVAQNLELDAGPSATEVNAANGFGSDSFSSLPSTQRLYFRGMGKEANSTTDITVSSGFTAGTAHRSRNNPNTVILRNEFRINTSTGETSNPTLAVSGDTASLFVGLVESGAGGITLAGARAQANAAATAGTLDVSGGVSLTGARAGANAAARVGAATVPTSVAPWGVPKIGTVAIVASGNVSPAIPANAAVGDLLVACISYRGSAAFTLPANWTLVATQQSSGDTNANGIASGLMAWIIRGESAPSTTFTRTGGDVALARIIAYSGAADSPYDTGSANTLGSASATVTTAGITTAEDGELLVAMTSAGDNLSATAFDAATDPAIASGATNTTSQPTVDTWLERADSGSDTGADGALAIADAVRGTAGSTGTIQATIAASAQHVMIVAAFKRHATKAWTVANGNKSATSTWLEGVVPGNGKSVQMNHHITIDEDWTIGESGASGTDAIFMGVANRVLTVLDGVTVRCRGGFAYRGAYANKTNVLNMEAGSHWIWDSSQASSPSTTKYGPRPVAGGTCASILINGTAAKRCSMSSDSGGGNGFFNRNGMNATGDFEHHFTDFARIGDATNPFYEVQTGDNGVNANKMILEDCTLDSCGRLNSTNAMQANGTWSLARTTMRNTLHATRCADLPLATASGTTKTLSGAVFDKEISLSDGAWEVGGGACFLGGLAIGARGVKAIQTGPTFINKSAQPTINGWGDLIDCYYLKDVTPGAFDNPHFWAMPNWADTVVEDCVFEYNGTGINGDILSQATPSVARTAGIRRNIGLTNVNGVPCGKMGSLGGGPNMSVAIEHNTYPSDVGAGTTNETGFQWGETGNEPVVTSFKSNLAHSSTPNRALLIGRFGGTVQNVVAVANIEKNAVINGFGGSDGIGYDSLSVGNAWTSAPDTTDIQLTRSVFFAGERKIHHWDAYLGGPGTAANAMAELAKRNDATGFDPRRTVAHLLAFVREGHQLIDATISQGHDGKPIGAQGMYERRELPRQAVPRAAGF